MAGIIPIPTTRVGDLFVRQRLTSQTQLDQLALFRLQNQISTGKRLQLPSDDGPAALRAINLQRLIDRKGQIQTNLQASNQFLGAADASLTSISSSLITLRGAVVGIAGTLSNENNRTALINDIDLAIESLVATGNTKSQGRYLFAGSRSQAQPFDFKNEFVEYSGNEGVLRSYVDLERLFDTNLAGTDVFGGISSQVQGGELNPHVSADTLLSTINGGSGISRNATISVSINTGPSTVTNVVDLRGAVTLDDVARLIEEGAPTGTEIVVDVTGSGLRLNTSSGTITVNEVAEGHAARELGILTAETDPLTNTINGDPLNPAVLRTTRLSNLLGTKAQGRIVSTSSNNNDIVITGAENGDALNGVTVIFVGGGVAGSEVVTYDDSNPLNKTLTVQIQENESTANQVAAAITAEGTFNAVVDYHDATSSSQAGLNPVDVANFGVITTGGSGDVLDTDSGFILTNGGQSVTIDLSTAETVEDLLNLVNGSDLGLLAEINATRDGINVRSRLSGADFTIGENGGFTATQLGLRTYTGETKLADFNRGVGVPTATDPTDNDLLITARDGTTQLSINLSTATTVDDVINLINVAASGAGVAITARLAEVGNGIELVDATVGTENLTVEGVEGSQAAEYLGFLPNGTVSTDGSGNQILTSEDRNTFETDSVFNTLIRLKQALTTNDTEEISRSIDRLDADLSRVNFARAEIGARLQNLGVIDTRLKDENVQLRSALSDDIDVDLVDAISNLTARQYAFEASLRTTASLLQLSLLNFI